MQTQEKNLADEVKLFAPIYIPDRDSLAIGLVPKDLVYRLEEYRSDERRWESVMWTFIGAVLGVVVNWVTSEPINISKTSIILIVILVLVILITGSAVRDYKKRADEMKFSLLSLETRPKIYSDDKDSVTPGKIKVTVIDQAGGKIVTAELPTDAAMSRLLPALITKMNLSPSIVYEIQHIETGKLLTGNETLKSADVRTNDRLKLLPKIIPNAPVESESLSS